MAEPTHSYKLDYPDRHGDPGISYMRFRPVCNCGWSGEFHIDILRCHLEWEAHAAMPAGEESSTDLRLVCQAALMFASQYDSRESLITAAAKRLCPELENTMVLRIELEEGN